jgi:hypothetical protein
MTADQRWKLVRAHIAKGDKAKDKADQHYIAAGRYLHELKKEHDGAGGTWGGWLTVLKIHTGLGKSRASELMAIADGRKTVEKVRADTAKRVADSKTRLKSSATSGEKSTAVEVINSEDGFNYRITDPKTGEQYVSNGCSYKDDPEASAEEMKTKFAALDDDDPAAPAAIDWKKINELLQGIHKAIGAADYLSDLLDADDWMTTEQRDVCLGNMEDCAESFERLTKALKTMKAKHAALDA